MSEYQIQSDFVKLIEKHILEGSVLMSALPLSTPTSIIQANKNTRMGVRAGVPDMILIVYDKIVFIEFKTPAGIISQHQKKWIERINKTGAKAYVCRSSKEAYAIVTGLLNQKNT